jgi:hypothetical protein
MYYAWHLVYTTDSIDQSIINIIQDKENDKNRIFSTIEEALEYLDFQSIEEAEGYDYYFTSVKELNYTVKQ